jgi:hypothetical protein
VDACRHARMRLSWAAFSAAARSRRIENVLAGDFLEGVDKYLHLVAPEREEELSAAIRARAEELAEADKDMVVDKPSEGGAGDRCRGAGVVRDPPAAVRRG